MNEKFEYKPPELVKLHVLIPKPLFSILQRRGQLASNIDQWVSKLIYKELCVTGVLTPIEEEYEGEPDPPIEDEPDPNEPDMTSEEVARWLRLDKAKTKTKVVYDPTKDRRASATPEKATVKEG